jgi:hypothetical protein
MYPEGRIPAVDTPSLEFTVTKSVCYYQELAGKSAFGRLTCYVCHIMCIALVVCIAGSDCEQHETKVNASTTTDYSIQVQRKCMINVREM